MGNKDFSRRGFLKTLGLTGAALTIGPAFNKVEAATAIVEGRKTITGNNALLIVHSAQVKRLLKCRHSVSA